MEAQYGQLMCSASDQKLCAPLFALHAPHMGRTQHGSIFLPEYLGRGWHGQTTGGVSGGSGCRCPRS